MSIKIHFDGRTVVVDADSDCSVLELARRSGLHVEARCGGVGSCASCNVMLGEGHYRVFEEDIELLVEQRLEVLSCQTYVLSDSAEIFLPSDSVISFEGARIADEMDIPSHTLNPTFKEGYGVAVDIGTTTVVAALFDLFTGKLLFRESLYNQQVLKADDVVSRISLCHTAGQLESLQELVIAHTLNPLIHKLCASAFIKSSEINHLTISGNTVMMHIFFGVSPVSIGTIPFEPVSHFFSADAKSLKIDSNPEALVESVPSISGYLGGDITSDLLVSLMNPCGDVLSEKLKVLIDIGTNGEMVASLDGNITACATAAGPAFEGAGLLHGMRATSQAIDTIKYDENLDFELSVIGDTQPMGLCGSAIIDFIADGFRSGLLNSFGRYDLELLKKQNRYKKVRNMHACILVLAEDSATNEPITITEGDIADVLKAKAAIYAGLKSLLAELKKTIREIDYIVLAGGFAKHVNLKNAICVGLLPDISLEKYIVIGNGSLAGASLSLLDQNTKKVSRKIIERPEVITLNKMEHFLNHFQEALVIPNLDEDDFPSIVG